MKLNETDGLLNVYGIKNNKFIRLKNIKYKNTGDEWLIIDNMEIDISAYLSDDKETSSPAVTAKPIVCLTEKSNHLVVIYNKEIVYINKCNKERLFNKEFDKFVSPKVLIRTVANTDNLVLFDNKQSSLMYIHVDPSSNDISILTQSFNRITKFNIKNDLFAIACNNEDNKQEIKTFDLHEAVNLFDKPKIISQAMW